MYFRPDIHALRAFAVLAVLFFHFEIPGFSGGFSGVDIFFVISGFLMTGIILQGLDTGRFSLWRFYWARVRRIVPAPTLVCAVLLVFGWFWLAPSEYGRLGWHSTASLGFFSNFVYKDESGYFDTLARQKWLLHTWALSVEWQFYLLYPLLLTGLARASRTLRSLVITLLAIGGISLLTSAIASPIKPDFSFFILVTRIWEMVAGGLLYLYLSWRPPEKDILKASIGLFLLAISMVLLHGEMTWPGYYAVLPVVAAVLFVIYAPQDHALINNIVTRKIGDWSYSMYLWHWPVVVAFYYFDATLPGWQIAGILLSVLLGAASYHWVEQPGRRLKPGRRSILTLLMPLLVVVMAGLIIMANKGFPARVDEAVLRADQENDNRYSRTDMDRYCEMVTGSQGTPHKRCQIGGNGEIGAILWGDSHAGTVMTALQKAIGKPIAYHITQCPVTLNARIKGKTQKANCAEFHDALLDHLAQAPSFVPLIIVSRLSSQVHGPNEASHRVYGLVYDNLSEDEQALDEISLYQKKLVESLCRVAKTRPTYVLKPIPEMGVHVPRSVARQLMTGQTPDISISMDEYTTRHTVVIHALKTAERECGITILDTPAYLCSDGMRCEGSENSRPLYSDDDHLSEFGNRRLIPLFETIK